MGHNNPADLSLLTDFSSYKADLPILKRVYITKKPLLVNLSQTQTLNVTIRDTVLLCPESLSLKSIGLLYKEIGLEKVEIDAS